MNDWQSVIEKCWHATESRVMSDVTAQMPVYGTLFRISAKVRLRDYLCARTGLGGITNTLWDTTQVFIIRKRDQDHND